LTPPGVFVRLVPFLLLAATLLFTFSGPIVVRLRGQGRRDSGLPLSAPMLGKDGQAAAPTLEEDGQGLGPVARLGGQGQVAASTLEKDGPNVGLRGQGQAAAPTLPGLVGLACAQLVIAVYGGYFGGGIGILMLAALAVMGMSDIHVMNGLKTLLASCINGVAVVTFVIAGVVVWPQAILMIVGAVIGGYGGAYYARKLPQRWVRIFVIVVGFSMTIYFFFLRK